jgi:hypothetical protein
MLFESLFDFGDLYAIEVDFLYADLLQLVHWAISSRVFSRLECASIASGPAIFIS